MNTLKRAAEQLQSRAEEFEAPDGLSICIGIDAWNEFFEVFDSELERMTQAESIRQQALKEISERTFNAGADGYLKQINKRSSRFKSADIDRLAQADPVEQMLAALKELRDAYQEFMGIPAVKANAAIAAAESAPRLPHDMLMAVAEAVRTACFESCNENDGDWAAITSLDLAEIIAELGAAEATGQENNRSEPVAWIDVLGWKAVRHDQAGNRPDAEPGRGSGKSGCRGSRPAGGDEAGCL
ncbi:hypothetical protein [Laribacter hongkongensis]|uniref:hypothetical protein n=1 Tax=Laribacter hongkongensis TaxID=168471 RepID=UPI001EFDC297|nr:hypothetical protein [Laribacter hongkongensis]MCG9096231.1 hypothetical protein [Laribacter hongkongensis]